MVAQYFHYPWNQSRLARYQHILIRNIDNSDLLSISKSITQRSFRLLTNKQRIVNYLCYTKGSKAFQKRLVLQFGFQEGTFPSILRRLLVTGISFFLNRLRRARYASFIYLNSLYWQVPLKKSCPDYMVFTVPERAQYRFCRIHFDVTNVWLIRYHFLLLCTQVKYEHKRQN